MKKLLSAFALLLLLLLGGELRAAPAVVNFSSERGVAFQLFFDGRPLTQPGARAVRIDRLTAGFHWAEFLIPTGYGRVVAYRTRVLLDPGLESSYVLLARPGYGLQLRKVAETPIRRGYAIGESVPYPPATPYGQYPDDYGYRRNDNAYPNASPAPQPVPGAAYPGGHGYPPNTGNQPSNSYPTPNAPYRNQAGSPTPNYPGSGGYNNATRYRSLTQTEVTNLAESMQRTASDEIRLSLARQTINQTSIQSNDLVRLLQTLSMEGSRLALAKYAYPYVADPQNFSRVYDVFDFEASIQELQRLSGAMQRP
ncbi:DUF4476 domain-containing protein [Hymenobacter defluvii]|uniref:DUF4476 domain-containing protein n=1 Tax=Hymenobacter defluvii TaxID=2054411 RepID=A0ABS3TG22_9BACT|nr:DUF4476 domain-containing protein [Hymenobacter defluvii]MBO3272587.1 DUF4476 domain-containing protein [Hymenobacter defluvii]